MVADGYKQTDVGVIPEDWQLKNFKEIFTFLTTATYSRADLREDGSIQYLHYGDIHTKYDFTLDFDKYELPHISVEQLRKYPLLKDGDIVMADASEDYNGICKSVEIQNLINKKAIAGLHTFLLRDKNNILINGFKGYIASSYLLKMQFDRLATGMKVFGVSKGNLLKVQVPIPPKQEQQAIATALSDTDELINSLEKLIAKKEAIKTGTMQELLTGKKRLDGFSGEWEEKTLGDIGESIIGLTYKPEDVSDLGTLVLRSSNVQNNRLAFHDNVYVDMELPNRVIVKKDDILICVRNGSRRLIGKCALIDESIEGQAFGAFMAIYRTKLASFVYYQFQSNVILKQIEEVMGATINQITNKDMASFKIPMPENKEEIAAISKILSDMDSDIDILKTKLSKVKAIKKGMMQELLTGKTRLLQEEAR